MSPAGIPPHVLAQLRQAFVRLVEIENNADIDWVALLELREHADPLTDDAYFRGYIMGVLDAVGVSTEEALQVLRTTTKGPRSRRRIVQLTRTG